MTEQGKKYLAQIPLTGTSHRTGILGLPGKIVRDRLDHIARDRGQEDRYGLFLPRAAELCGHSIDGAYTVVELGPGDGWALSCERPSLKKIAIDAGSRHAAKLSRAGIEFHECDISTDVLPVGDHSVDLIMMIHVIEHIRDPAHLMMQFARILRKGGGLYFRTPNIIRLGHRFWDDYTHVKPYTPDAIQRMAKAFGFECRYLLASDHKRICLDLLTNGRFRSLLFHGGWEIEAGFTY